MDNPVEVDWPEEEDAVKQPPLSEDRSRNDTPKFGLSILSLALYATLLFPAVREILRSWCLLVLFMGVSSALLVAFGAIEDYLASRKY